MNVNYTSPKGNRVSIFYWSDYDNKPIPGQFYRSYVEAREISEDGKLGGKEIERPVKIIDEVPYFEWKGELISIWDYEYHTMEMLVQEIEWAQNHKDRWFIRKDTILASFMKQPDQFRCMIPCRRFDFKFPGLGFGIVSDSSKPEMVSCVPNIERRKISEWHYKIDFMPEFPGDKELFGHEEYYWNDFCSLVFSGHIKVVWKGGE